jgi:hypothetical protein
VLVVGAGLVELGAPLDVGLGVELGVVVGSVVVPVPQSAETDSPGCTIRSCPGSQDIPPGCAFEDGTAA